MTIEELKIARLRENLRAWQKWRLQLIDELGAEEERSKRAAGDSSDDLKQWAKHTGTAIANRALIAKLSSAPLNCHEQFSGDDKRDNAARDCLVGVGANKSGSAQASQGDGERHPAG